MKSIKPYFYGSFKCTASDCTDTCCAGWEVDVDEITLSRYQKDNSAFGKTIRDNLVSAKDGYTYIRLKSHERCAFLNDRNLCDIITNCGEGYLCDICRMHPRFFEWLPDRTEAGLGLCCEEVCRLLFESSEKLSFITEEDEDTDDESFDDYSPEEISSCKALASVRDEMLCAMQNRSLSLEQRFDSALSIAVSSEKQFFKTETTPYIMSDEEILEQMKSTEPIDESWAPLLKSLGDNLDIIHRSETEFNEKYTSRSFEYEHLSVYFIYRYIMKSFFDGEIVSRLLFCFKCVRFIKLCDVLAYVRTGEFTLKNRIDNVKYVSKQIEYSDENIEILTGNDSLKEYS